MIVYIVIAALALLLHLSMKWLEYRESFPQADARAYVQDHPARVAMAVISSVLAFIVVWEMELMNGVAAAACGYMGNSIVDNLAKRFSP